MPNQPTDVEIAGAGYMLAPGTYRREQDGLPEGRPGRIVVRDFFGGQRRAFQLERDRGWDGAGVGPAYDGQAKESTRDQHGPWSELTAPHLGRSQVPRIDPRSRREGFAKELGLKLDRFARRAQRSGEATTVARA